METTKSHIYIRGYLAALVAAALAVMAALAFCACLATPSIALASPAGGENGQAAQQQSQGESFTVQASTPVAAHGALSVRGTDLVDEHGNPYQLHGMSTHGIAWFPQFVNHDAFRTLRDDWNANVVRLAMYTAEYGGYCTGGDQAQLRNLVASGVDFATQLGMYAIIDWHVMNEDANPLRYKDQAKQFFSDMSARYAAHQNVLYEICNEPVAGTSWADIKAYANEVIPVIRANDPDAVVIVGTPEWSQRVDQAAADRLAFGNVMYSAHFYANTHTQWMRDRIVAAHNAGLPVFFSEFGICDASGNGGINYGEASAWMELASRYNISYCKWSLSNKDETASAIAPWCAKTSGWTEGELSETGRWIRNQLRSEGPDSTGGTGGDPDAPGVGDKPEDPDFTVDPSKGVFIDTKGHWADTSGVIKRAVELGLMNGYGGPDGKPSGNFGPDDPITREQVACVLYNQTGLSSYPTHNQTPCADMREPRFSTAAVNWTYDTGIMRGYVLDDGTRVMRPDQPVTRDELAKMLYAFVEYMGGDTSIAVPWAFWAAPDAWMIEDFARTPVAWLYDKKIMTGDGATGRLNPLGRATRAEAAKMFIGANGLL